MTEGSCPICCLAWGSRGLYSWSPHRIASICTQTIRCIKTYRDSCSVGNPFFFKWVKIWLQVSGMCMCVIYCTCLQRRSMCIRWAPTRLLCQSCAQALLVHTRGGAVGILAARQPPWRPSIDHLQGQKDMYLSIEIITPTVQPSCTGNVFYYLAKRREMWGGK